MCSCCCKKSRQGKGCCTWMVHGVLANFLSLANLLNFLLSVFILGYSVFETTKLSFGCTRCFIIHRRFIVLFSLCLFVDCEMLFSDDLRVYMVVLIQSGTYILYMNHSVQMDQFTWCCPTLGRYSHQHHIKTTKVILTV